MQNDDANLLLARIVDGTDHDGWAANELVNAFRAGLDLSNLKALMTSPEGRIRSVAAWIGSELGSRAAPLLAAAVELLADSERDARFYSLDIVLVCTTDPTHLFRALRLLDDADRAVRKKAVRFAASLTETQLAALIGTGLADVDHVSGLRLLLPPHRHHALVDALRSTTRLVRKYALAAAMRFRDAELISAASSGPDAELADLARHLT